MPKISIIVPVYNAEKYLPKCIDSLCNQTLKDIEIILVDDGSTDLSLEICKKYAEKDQRIIIISKENEGLAKARADGINKANAAYISFLDSDDYYEVNFCEKMYAYMIGSVADLVECDYYKAAEDMRTEHRLYATDLDLDRESFHNEIVRKTIVNGTEAVVVWNKLYRKDIIERSIADYGNSPLEDYVFNTQYYTLVNRYVYIHQCLTNYRQIPMSLSRKCNLRAFDILKNAETVKENCLEKMGLVTDADKKDDSQWFVHYTVNYLHQYLMADIPHTDVFLTQILTDCTLFQKSCLIVQENTYAKWIADGNISKAISVLKNRAKREKMKIQFARIKRSILRITH